MEPSELNLRDKNSAGDAFSRRYSSKKSSSYKDISDSNNANEKSLIYQGKEP
jgi:hypothetical protein